LFTIGNYRFGNLSALVKYRFPDTDTNELLQEYSTKVKNTDGKERLVLLEFPISKLIHRKTSMADLSPDIQFKILNDYIAYKGAEFKRKLILELIKSEVKLNNLIYGDDGMRIPTELTRHILDMFDVKDIYKWLTEVVKLRAPADLRDEYVSNNHREDRDQTYTKEDYLQLAALTIALKPVLGIIGKYASIKKDVLGKNYIELYSYRFISMHPVSRTPAFVKLKKYVERLSSASQLGGEDQSIRIIEKGMSSDDIKTWLIGITVIKKVMVSSVINDSANSHIIGGIYKFISNRLNNDGNVSNKIRERKYGTMGGSEEDKMSVLEHYTTTYDLSYGTVVEIEEDLSNVERILDKLTNGEYDRDVYDDAKLFLRPMLSKELSSAQIRLLSYVLCDYIHPDALFHVSLDIIVGLMAVAFTKLWKEGHYEVAILMTSIITDKTEGAMILTSTSNISKVSQSIKDELDIHYPYKKKQISAKGNQDVSLIDMCISALADEIYSHNWDKLATMKYVKEISSSQNDIKVILAEYIISLNK